MAKRIPTSPPDGSGRLQFISTLHQKRPIPSGIILGLMANSNFNSCVAILGRWQPLHLGHQAVLRALCDQFERVIIGIGSANIQDYRNPFTIEETTRMLQLGLEEYHNYSLIPVPDLFDDQDWCEIVIDRFGTPDFFVTANPFVQSLLGRTYVLAQPTSFVREDHKVPISATMVRREMARGDGWQSLVPVNISEFIRTNHLDQRFRGEFGLQTLAMELIII